MEIFLSVLLGASRVLQTDVLKGRGVSLDSDLSS